MLRWGGEGNLYGVSACMEEARGDERRVASPDFPLELLPPAVGNLAGEISIDKASGFLMILSFSSSRVSLLYLLNILT